MNRVITIDPLVILISMLNTGLLFIVVKRLLFDKVNAVINARRLDIEKSYNDANEKNEEALLLYTKYENKLNRSQDEAAIILNKALVKQEEILNDAKLMAEGIKQKAIESAEVEKQRVRQEVMEEVTDLAILAATKIVQKEMDEESNKNLLEEFLAM